MSIGRKPLPTRLKVIRGTAQPCRVNKAEPKPPADRVKMPPGLSKAAKAQWRRVAGDLRGAGILTNLDIHALGAYCETYAQWREAADKVNQLGSVIKDNKSEVKRNPYLFVEHRALDQLKSFWSDFGMTPSSRSRIHAAGDTHDANKFANNGRRPGRGAA